MRARTNAIIDIVESCMTGEALELLQKRQRPLLNALSRENPNLYAQIGAAFAKRTVELNGEQCAISRATGNGEPCAIRGSDAVRREAPISRRKRRARQHAKTAEPADGEACAKPTRRRPDTSARPVSRRTMNASAAVPQPS